MKKKLLSLLLALIMVLSMVPATAFAAEEETATPIAKTGELSGSMKNPLYSPDEKTLTGWQKAETMLSQISGGITAEKVEVYESNLDKVAAAVTDALVARKTTIPVQFSIRKSDITSEGDLDAYVMAIFVAAMGHNGNPNQGDYLLWQYGQMEYGGAYYEGSTYYDLEITYTVQYYTTAKQEAAVTAKVNEVLDSFGFTEETADYTAVKAVYDYICANVKYDTANVNNASYTRMYTAYAALIDGKAVCQGYATLLYRMLLELGIDCRVITGDTNGDGKSDHAWNIVGMGLLYYNCDATWDAGSAKYNWFLRCPDNFAGHTRDALYDLQEFHDVYPMAGSDYVYGEEILLASGTCGESVNWKLNAEGVLTVSGEGAMTDYGSENGMPWYEWKDSILGVVIEKGVTHVGNYAFNNCDSLIAVSVDGARTVGQYAFQSCDSLIAVDLLEGVEEIGDGAFQNHQLLYAVSMPASLQHVGSYAFAGMGELAGVVIEDLSAWCAIEFTDFGSNPLSHDGTLYLGTEPITDLVIPTDVTAIAPHAFYSSSFRSVTIHDGVTAVGNYAFGDMGALEAVYISDLAAWCAIDFASSANPLSNGVDLYVDGTKVVDLVIPAGVSKIGDFAFGSSNIRSVTMGADVTEIGVAAFGGSAVTDVTFGPNVEIIGENAFWNADVTKVVIPDKVTVIPGSAFRETPVKEVIFGKSVETVGEFAFHQCRSLEKVTFNEGLRQLNDFAFNQCSKLQSIILPASVELLGIYALSECKAMESVTFTGDMPDFAYITFRNTDPIVYYPCGNDTWTREAMADKGISVWKPVHADNSEVSRTEPTCSAEGQVDYACQRCGEISTETLPMIPHPEEILPAVPATCTTSGLTEGKKCADCGEVLKKQTTIPALGHSVKNGVCDTCGEVFIAITKQLESVAVGEGEKAVVSFAAEGEDLTYTWYYAAPGSDKFAKTSSFTSNTYSITMKAERDGRRVYCVITDKNGYTLKTDIATLSLEKTPLEITQQPVDVTVKNGEKAVVTVEATGDGLTYEWYYATAGSTKFTKTTSFTGPEYSLTMKAERDGRQVYCRVTDAYGQTVQTATVTLSMEKTPVTPLVITKDLEDVTVKNGEKAIVSVEATGDGLTYEWYYAAAGSTKFTKTTSFTGPEYSLTMKAERDGRQVYCRVTDAYGQTVQTATVTLSMKKTPVTPLVITKDLEDVTAKNGEKAVVSVEATGDGLKYEWYYSDNGGKSFAKTSSFTGPEYSVTMKDARDGRQVYCRVTDAYGETVKTAVATLHMEAAPVTPLEITKDLEDVTAKNGEKAVVSVEATGDGLTYAWYYSDNGGKSFKLTTSFKSNTYSVTMKDGRDGRQVYCRVTDAYGKTVKTEVATLHMEVADKTPLVITKQPVGVTVAEGEKAIVSVEAEGDGLTYKWYWAPAYSKDFKLTTSFKSNTYSLTMRTDRDGRQVYCEITDQYGNTVRSDIATLRMGESEKTPLAITAQPHSVTVAEGEKATVMVKATGDGLTYEWYYSDNGGKSFAKTSSFTGETYSVTMKDARDGRQVYCKITDQYGNFVKSETATLTMQ